MTKVIKKGGKIETFDSRKLRRAIASAAKESGIPSARAREVTRSVSKTTIAIARKKKEISWRDLRSMVLRKLDSAEPAVSRAWRRYERKR